MTFFYRILVFICVMSLSKSMYGQTMVFAAPAIDNQKIIKRYNRYHFKMREAPRRPYGFTAIFGVKTNSIMSTADVEVNIVKRWVQDAAINDKENRLYFIEIKNKTDKTIYIDKGKSFRIYHDGSKFCYYDPNRDDTCLTRVITIPPHATRNLSDYNAVLVGKGEYKELKIIDYPEDFHWDARAAGICEGFLRDNEVRLYSETNSPYYRSFLITYSKDEDFSSYSLLTINFYMRELIGCYYLELYQDERIFERFGGDQYTITNCEYGYGGVNRFRGEDKPVIQYKEPAP